MTVNKIDGELTPICLFQKVSAILSEINEDKLIYVKTEGAINEFIEYLESIPERSFSEIKINKEEVITETNNVKTIILSSIQSFLSGDVFGAVNEVDKLVSDLRIIPINKDKIFYRGRSCDFNYLLKKEEMFHIPLNNRYLVKNQRYSLSGFPCLYLGETTYTCWEELERPDFGKTNFVALKNLENILVYDLSFPSKILSINDLVVIVIIIATSFQTNKSYDFKPEYIFSQTFLHNLIKNRLSKKSSEIIGLIYHSVFMYKSDIQLFAMSNNLSEADLKIYKSYVFPIINTDSVVFCETLSKLFSMTNSISYNTIVIQRVNNQLEIPSGTQNEESTIRQAQYKDTFFSDIDEILNNFDYNEVSKPSKRTYKGRMKAGQHYLSIE